MKECECPEEHSITKLGHCRTCPFFKRDVDHAVMLEAHDGQLLVDGSMPIRLTPNE